MSKEIVATPADVPSSAGFTLSAPQTRGDFDVLVTVDNAPAFIAFNIGLEFDPTLLRVAGASYGTALGTPDDVFCPSVHVEPRRAVFACTSIRGETSQAAGLLATFHLHSMGSGSTSLHLVTYDEGGSSSGTFIVDSKPSTDSAQPITLPLHDLTLTVEP